MYVIYKVNLTERQPDAQFPKLKRMFKREIVESNCDNPHLSLAKWAMKHPLPNECCYSIGVIK